MATTTDKYIPQRLDRWTLPKNYFGAEWPDYYVFLSQHRDSDTLTRSNTWAVESDDFTREQLARLCRTLRAPK